MNKLIVLTLVLLLVIFLFIYVNSQKTATLFNFGTSPSPKPIATEVKNTIVNLVIKNKKLIDGPQALQVTQGQMVILKIAADQNGVFYFQGYNKNVYLEKGKIVVLSFLANMTGHYEYELEDSKTVLGAIDVYPQ